MKSYEQSIQELGHEIADDIIRKEENPKWEVTFYREKVAKSISAIHDRDLRKTIEDLEDSIKKSMKKIKDKKSMQ